MMHVFEKAAMRGEPMPDELKGPEQMLYLSLRHLYGSHKLGIVDTGTAKREKQKLEKEYELMRLDYRCWKQAVAERNGPYGKA